MESGKPNAESVDPSAAFPTAALVAYWRGVDAASEKPFIGRNIGGSADRLAATLAGTLGKEFADAIPGDEGGAANGMAARTMWYDDKWMQALDQGCKQFVLLAAGLDTRAWRMPRHDASVKVFELDMPTCFVHKNKQLASLPEEQTKVACTRIPVDVDLSNPSWTEHLVASGFNPADPSFFLAEGLLMYLPPEAVPVFFEKVSSVASVGSTFAGCCFVDNLGMMNHTLGDAFAKFGAKFTFEAKSEAQLRALLEAAKFDTEKIIDQMQTLSIMMAEKTTAAVPKSGAAQSDDQQTQEQSQKLLQVCTNLHTWTPSIREEIKAIIEKDGYHGFAEHLVKDIHNFHGLRDESSDQKVKIVNALMESNFESLIKASLEKAAEADAEVQAKAGQGDVDQGKAEKQAEKMLLVVSGLKMWPSSAIDGCWKLVEGSGYRAFAKAMVDDQFNFQGLRDESQAQKARVVDLLMDGGFESTTKPLFEDFLARGHEKGVTGYVHFLSKKV
eukprot:TRINITY_DN15642_c0_g1_i1.p1 TRINITY_DN15642_c0_g1~~TRINITY_DN15642_c0_g1_i1.p1  ORF type:complete len:500 (-),score=108.17 TRINITY_DN15642_c0_g1_i1:108-1607(-)